MMEITYDKIPSPGAGRRLENWNTAIGLQAIDNLTPSEKLVELAREHIDGKRTIDEIDYTLKTYYADLSTQGITTPHRQIEADIVSTTIERLLETDSFVLNEGSLKAIHKALFRGFDEYAPGEYRAYDFTKNEWVLQGDTVTYEHWEFLEEEIAACIRSESSYSPVGPDAKERVAHIAGFISEIWLYHAFREGNTRVVALLAIKYLRSIGYQLNNEAFEKHALFFRNALVRANYRNEAIRVVPTDAYLLQFFGNILLGENNDLKSRRLHIYWDERTQDFSNHDENGALVIVPELSYGADSGGSTSADAQNGTANGTANGMVNNTTDEVRLAILSILADEPTLSYDEIAGRIGKGRRTVARAIRQLKDLGAIKRVGSDKSGHWVLT
ncbi:MAG: Fic family protein [Coriobacteriales bacterium]|jgi:fido (protein-threonine AMPylation protein)|nr:Fic family protein [Coriobacteriales bacterium]